MTASNQTASPRRPIAPALRLAALAILLLAACAVRPVAPAQHPSDPGALATQQCREALNRRQHAQALPVCDAAVRARPASAAAWLDRSAVHLGLSQPAAAEADATRALQLDPSNYGAHNNRGLSFLRRGQPAQAITDFNQSLHLRPDHVNALRNRGFAHRALGANDQALADFDRVVRLNPGLADGYGGRGTTLARLGRPEAGLPDMETAVRLAPTNPEARNDRGWVRERAGQTEAALEDYAAALALRPGYALAETNHRRLLARLHPEAQTQPPPATQAEPMPPPPPSVPPPGVVTLPAERETVPIPNPLPPSLSGTFTTGSGVVLGDGRWVVTNHHVIAGSRSVVLRNGAGHLLRAQVVAMAPADDLALLRIETVFPGAPAVQLSALAEPRAGRAVLVLGFPNIGMFGSARPTVVAGMVAKADGLHDDLATFQTTARIRPGNSGGPIFDLNGRLLGVMSARLLWQHGGKELRDDDSVPMSVGVKSDRILRLMRAAQPANATGNATFTAEELYHRLQDSIVLVAAYP